MRKATLKDAEVLYDVLNNTPELKGTTETEEYPMYWINGAVQDTKNYLFIIAQDNNQFCGFLNARVTPSVKEAVIVDIYVVPSQRKKGLASKLMQYFEKIVIAQGYHWLVGFIEKDNKKSQSLFEKFGYKKGKSLLFYNKILGAHKNG